MYVGTGATLFSQPRLSRVRLIESPQLQCTACFPHKTPRILDFHYKYNRGLGKLGYIGGKLLSKHISTQVTLKHIASSCLASRDPPCRLWRYHQVKACQDGAFDLQILYLPVCGNIHNQFMLDNTPRYLEISPISQGLEDCRFNCNPEISVLVIQNDLSDPDVNLFSGEDGTRWYPILDVVLRFTVRKNSPIR